MFCKRPVGFIADRSFFLIFIYVNLNIPVISLTEKIKRKALAEGFHKVGVVRAEPLREESERFRQWLENNYHGAMQWIEREPEKRADPKLLFPPVKSILVVALNYYTPHEHEESETTGKISRYAWGDDYHDVLKDKLRALLEWIKTEVPEADGKICVDTAPIMDKAWAVRAGLGWLGKHSNLITKEYGSWVFLGEILLNLDLEYDAEIEPDHCGSCTKCLDACPTGAIVAPLIVDSNKCLSYATIELRSPELPLDIAENLNGWIYGCDICQDVCPWNRFEKPTEETRFEPRRNETSTGIDEILSFTPEKYAERFRRSPIKRAKLGGLQRNAKALKRKSSR
ncbi:MAG: putative iron-sulfur cluster binding protein [Acidobacteria bacterium]|jgi:epoxyqueuosine reductase|nr:putative iron-sulfur cluster binding protein [Acidobacteriota bacterium]